MKRKDGLMDAIRIVEQATRDRALVSILGVADAAPIIAKRDSMKTYDVYWSPEGRKIATVQAKDERAAIRKAPLPYRKFLGEMYAQETK